MSHRPFSGDSQQPCPQLRSPAIVARWPATWRQIPVRKLIELLQQVPADYWVSAQAAGATGDLVILRHEADCPGIGIVAIGDEEVQYFEPRETRQAKEASDG